MAKTLFLATLFITTHVLAQSPADTSRKALITPGGNLLGTPFQQSIGPGGGTVQSADGKLRVVFPTGALNKETIISIRNHSNGIMNSDSGCYQLEPSGIRFQKPVQLIFKYDGDAGQSVLFSIATQDTDGQWWSLRKSKIDTLNKTITGEVPHFSKWALFERLVLRPKQSSLRTRKSLSLVVIEYSQDEELLKELKKNDPSKNYSSDGDLLAPLVEIHGNSSDADYLPPLPPSNMDDLPPLPVNYKVSSWTVNGITNGNAEVGTISNKQKKSATYTAPASEPSQNPVAVTAKLEGMSYIPNGGKKMRTLYLTSNIKIIGSGYLFTYIHKNFAGCFHTIDSSSCIIKPNGNSVTLSDIINYKAWSDWDPCTHCNAEWLNKETFKANVEIWGMKNGVVTPATETNPLTKYMINLVQAFGNTPSQRLACPKQPVVTMPSIPIAAQPTYINFETDGKDIIIHYFGITAKNTLSKKTGKEEFIIRIVKLDD